MTGCDWCGVGSDDECTPNCAAPVNGEAPSQLQRIARHMLDDLKAQRPAEPVAITHHELGLATGKFFREAELVYVVTDEVRVELSGGNGRWTAIVVSTDGDSPATVVAEVSVSAAHWSTAADAFAAVADGYV